MCVCKHGQTDGKQYKYGSSQMLNNFGLIRIAFRQSKFSLKSKESKPNKHNEDECK